jgi:hypothetical protein
MRPQASAGRHEGDGTKPLSRWEQTQQRWTSEFGPARCPTTDLGLYLVRDDPDGGLNSEDFGLAHTDLIRAWCAGFPRHRVDGLYRQAMSWATWVILIVYLVLLVIAIVQRHPTLVLSVLIAGMLACAVRMFFIEQAWLSVVSVGLLLVGSVLFRWAAGREHTR